MFTRATLSATACFITGGVAGSFFFDRILRRTTVQGPSMQPLFYTDDKIIGLSPYAWCWIVKFWNLLKNDKLPYFDGRVIVCQASPGTNYCKVAFLDETATTMEKLNILGVNAKESKDSREFGQVPICSVKSVVLFKYSPNFVWVLGKEMEIR